ncbi:MAG: arylsulfatase [Acidobacteria bacterium]|nr:arylsulfatase [Acidobacteriota bacterium]
MPDRSSRRSTPGALRVPGLSSRRDFLKFAPLAAVAEGARARPGKPNIIFILADDIGYGDLSCYGAERVRTPNVDRIAREGIRFTDAHAPASVCTPTRYAALTGQYAWRNPAGDHILSGEAPLSIDPSTTTLASMLKRAGYRTGHVGKWHLGVGERSRSLDWNLEIRPGPLELGFDYAYYYPATNDRVPCVYVENHRVAGLTAGDPLAISYAKQLGNEPTGREHPEMLKLKLLAGHDGTIVNGISRIGFMSGGKPAWWDDERMADTLTAKAVEFIEEKRSAPFFLYFATSNIHQPRWPHPRFRGAGGCGTRCDSIAEFDSSVGAVLAALDRKGLTDNTLLVISSDNGPAMDDGYQSFDVRDANGHDCNGPWRGYKGSLYEGGHREPFLARWPGRIRAGSQSGELLCLVDLLATMAAAAGQKLSGNEGPDSFNLLPALLGQARRPVRDHLVLQGNGSGRLAVRRGPWKLILATKPGESPELYNLESDPGETRNAAEERPGVVAELSRILAHNMAQRRSRPQ